jgi:hypothetical protein
MSIVIKTLTILFITISISLKGQITFFIGDKTYSATTYFKLWDFNHRIEWDNDDINVLIARNGVTGMIVLERSTDLSSTSRIKGNISIYLDDNSIITCIDRNKFDIVDGTATTVYYLTKEEIDKLKISNIRKLRYSFGDTTFGVKNFIVENHILTYTSGPFEFTNTIGSKTDVSQLVRELFDN